MKAFMSKINADKGRIKHSNYQHTFNAMNEAKRILAETELFGQPYQTVRNQICYQHGGITKGILAEALENFLKD